MIYFGHLLHLFIDLWHNASLFGFLCQDVLDLLDRVDLDILILQLGHSLLDQINLVVLLVGSCHFGSRTRLGDNGAGLHL